MNVQRQTHHHAHVHSQMKTAAGSPSSHGGSTTRSGLDQRDRSLTVMIPRAKYRPTPQQAPSILTMSTFGPEQKAMSYLDPRQTPTKVNDRGNNNPTVTGRNHADERKRNNRIYLRNAAQGSRCSSRKPSDSTQRSLEVQPPQRKKHAAPKTPSTGSRNERKEAGIFERDVFFFYFVVF